MPALELEAAGDPPAGGEAPTDLASVIVQAAAVAVDEPAGRIGDQLAERRDAIPERHQLEPTVRMPAMTDFPSSHRDLLDAEVATLATIDERGFPALSEVWFLFDEGEVKVSLNTARLKTKNLRARPECSLFILDLASPYRYLEVRGPGADRARRRVRFRREGRREVRRHRPEDDGPPGGVARRAHDRARERLGREHARLIRPRWASRGPRPLPAGRNPSLQMPAAPVVIRGREFE